MKIIKKSKLLHRWLMLFVGVQCIIWSITGLYMVVFDIDYIHGDNQIVNQQNVIDSSAVNYSFAALFQRYPMAERVVLSQLTEEPQFVFQQKGKRFAVSAITGETISPITQQVAKNIAQYHYQGHANIKRAVLITENPPFELRANLVPAWRIDFDDHESTSLYISEETGSLVSKRHQYWRIFDWMFRLHVMDYDDGENMQNVLLFLFASFGLCAAISGVVLTYVKVIKPLFKRKKSAINKQTTHKKTPFYSRIKKHHQWLSVIVGIQVLIWLTTGLFFNLMDTEKAKGRVFFKEPIIEHRLQVNNLYPIDKVLTSSSLTSNKPSVEVALISLLNKPIYKITHFKGLYPHFYNDYTLIDAYSGELIRVDETLAGQLALSTYSGSSKINQITLVSPPIDDFLKQQNSTWKINFADPIDTAIYIEEGSGRLVGHSNNDKRFVDMFFTLHFMDYAKTGGFNHWVIIIASLFTLWFVFSGVLLIYQAIKLQRYLL